MSKAFEGPRVAGAKAMLAGDYRGAILEFRAGAEAAGKAGDWVSRGRFLANEGGSYMYLGENRPAIRYLLLARELAAKAGDLLTLQGVEANLANVYVLTGDYEAAGAAAGRGAQIRPTAKDRERQVKTLMSFGRAMAKARGVDAAVPIWREALAGAEAVDSRSLEADILELWGYELGEQDSGRLVEAEEVLARAWYKRKLAKDKRMPLTEGKLARLYRKQGKLLAARRWMDRTLEALERGQRIPVPEWVLRAEEAQISSEEGRLQASMTGFRRAQRLVEKWRDALPPMERVRLGAERRMAQELFEGYLQTAGRLYRKEPSAALAAEMFTLIQNTRAWSMEASGTDKGRESPLYSEARRLEGRWLAGEEAAGVALKNVRATILENEARMARGEAPARRSTLEEPGEGDAVLTYWLHAEGSWLWVWTKRGLRMTPLTGRDRILAAADGFRRAVEENRAEAGKLGGELRTMLLGSLERECLTAKRWDIAADEGLFHIPFGALPGTGGKYLAEDVEVRLIPNALRIGEERTAERRFFAVADPIFNNADERRAQAWTWQRAVHAGAGAVGLPRLPGTGREAAAAGAAMRKAGYETAVYAGAESGEEAVLERLIEWRPGIIHIATHTLEAQGRPRLALSLRSDGSPGLLTAEDIAALPLRAELVVMSACHSTGTETVRGSGLLGLTRAWLTAGSRHVISTLWPVGDESTAFFSTFYERLASENGAPVPVASALRQAQLACIRGGGVSAEPRNWAGHVLLARR
jgi:tetratricopeptide (TPR) repeat protein